MQNVYGGFCTGTTKCLRAILYMLHIFQAQYGPGAVLSGEL